MVRCLGLFALLCAFSLGESFLFSGAGEASLCRSYFTARDEGLIEKCEYLWLYATVFQSDIQSIDCQSCKHQLKNNNYSALSKILKIRQKLDVGIGEIKDLHKKLNDESLLCALIGQCYRDSFVLPSLKFKVNTTCDDCKKIFDDVRGLLQDNDTKNAVAGYLKKAICFELPLQVIDICKHTIDSYIGVLMDLAASEIESGPICSVFGLCSTPKILAKAQLKSDGAYSWIKRPAPVGFEFFHSRLSPPKQSEDSTACTECINVFSRIRDETKDPQFDQVLKNVVKDKLCESFGYFKSMCEAAVSSEVDSMIDNASKMNITDLCFFFNQCKQNVSAEARAFKASLYNRFSQKALEFPFLCPICEKMFEKVFALIMNNRSEAAIVWALEEVCYILPSETRHKCLDFFEECSDFIVHEIIEGTTPKLLCMSIGICNTFGVPQVPVQNSECQLCKTIVDIIYQNIEENATKEEIIKEFDNVCSHLPYVRDQCKLLVDKYASQVIDMLVQGMPAGEVCQKLGFCKAPSTLLKSKVGDSCVICEGIVAELYIKLQDNVTIDRIKYYLETLCNVAPSSFSDRCRSMVEQNTAAIIDMIIQKYSPRKVCEELSICYYHLHAKTDKCDVCKEIIDYIYTRLEDDATADHIEKVLETVCQYMPTDELKSTCHEYVRAYTQVLIDLLVRNVQPQEICQDIHLCPPHFIVQSLCSGDPSIICRDNYTAKLCSREAFCREFFWQRPDEGDSKTRRPTVRKYDCRKLDTMEERCSDARLMRLCGFESFCLNFKGSLVELSEACQFCRNLLAQRLTYGSSGVDCSLYVNPEDKRVCERIRKLKLSGRTSFNSLESICKKNELCVNKIPLPPSSPSEAKNILGGDPCLWGPSVTCRDLDIAARCGVTTYCQQNVWKGKDSERRIGLHLVDCDRPLDVICISPDLRYCGSEVLEKCRIYSTSQSIGDMRNEMCKDRPLSFCSDPKMVELCGMGEYCEAMSMTPTPTPPTTQVDDAPIDPRCRLGAAFVCQNYQNAVLCGEVELCRTRGFWL
ncbi:unnamed protein product [Hymenolepis diminuta]|uniref:Saposin B-type domain-containing protein n=1 Tax=Hymenolepis diminuta TaxID=6216 RepID=A0A564YWP3_HYMDI|nr:unnamed protein product [Hymenolepis diminuta]